MSVPELILLVGLTGVGKSTAVAALLEEIPDARLLANRRELADRIVIPEAQRLTGEVPRPVRDRLERFRLTSRYGAVYPGGLAHALDRHLRDLGQGTPSPLLLFDNLRGEAEVGFACDAFPSARFVVLEAPAAVRVMRLAGRGDAFDRVGGVQAHRGTALRGRLEAIEGLGQLVDLDALARAAADLDPEAVVVGARVVAEESLHYDPATAWRRLERLPKWRRIRLDTGRLSPSEVVERLRAWL